MSANPTLISTVRDFAVKIVNADGTGLKSLSVAPPAAGTRVKSLIVASDDTVARVLQLVKTIGGVAYILGEVDIPIGAGTDGLTAAVDVYAAPRIKGLQTDGIVKWIDVANGDLLGLQAKVAITAGKTIYVSAEGGDFT
jgi:hypothetical protein